uniref:Putative secreted protein n=1 Tax=Anopheles darlingi TaxID=43151 RepID=A0A2M4DIG8_ANODA
MVGCRFAAAAAAHLPSGVLLGVRCRCDGVFARPIDRFLPLRDIGQADRADKVRVDDGRLEPYHRRRAALDR